MRSRYLPVVTLFASLALADVQFTSPAAGGEITASGTSVTISAAFKDSGDDPPLSDLATYSVYLFAGGNEAGTNQQIGAPIAVGKTFGTATTISGSVLTSTGDSIENAYFLSIVSIPKTGGGTVTNYSPRFSISGMKGTFPPAIEKAAKAITGTAGPDTANAVVAADQAAGGANTPEGSAALDYADQTGPTKYAPMQGRPGTKITAKSASLRYPISSVSFYKTYAPIPKQVTTQTASITWTVSSKENDATPVAQPDGDMQKFLNRWKD